MVQPVRSPAAIGNVCQSFLSSDSGLTSSATSELVFTGGPASKCEPLTEPYRILLTQSVLTPLASSSSLQQLNKELEVPARGFGLQFEGVFNPKGSRHDLRELISRFSVPCADTLNQDHDNSDEISIGSIDVDGLTPYGTNHVLGSTKEEIPWAYYPIDGEIFR